MSTPKPHPFKDGDWLLVARTPAAYDVVASLRLGRGGTFNAYPTSKAFCRSRTLPVVFAVCEGVVVGWQDDSLNTDYEDEECGCPVQYMQNSYPGYRVFEVPDQLRFTRSGKLSLNT